MANELLACKQGQEHPELDRKGRERMQTLLPDWKWKTRPETWELNPRQALYRGIMVRLACRQGQETLVLDKRERMDGRKA